VKTIKVLSCLLIFLFVSSVVYSQGVKTYKNLKYNYKMTIPNNWEVEEKPSSKNAETVTFTDLDGYKMTIISKVDKSLPKTANDLDPGTMYSAFSKDYKGANFVESDYAEIDNNLALYCKYTYPEDGKEYSIVRYHIVKSNILYTIQIEAVTDNFEYFENLSRGYIFSFSIANVTAPNAFRSETLNFRIVFPDGWKIRNEVTRIGAESSEGANIYIEINENEDYKGYSANDLRAEELIEVLRTQHGDAEVIERNYTTLDNYRTLYVKYSFSAKVSGKTEKFILVDFYIIRGYTMYIIHGLAPLSIFESVREKIFTSIETFQFLDDTNY